MGKDIVSLITSEIYTVVVHIALVGLELWFDGSVIANELKKLVTGYMDVLSILYAQRNNLAAGDPNIETARNELVTLIEHKLDQRLELIFRMLGLQYPPDDIMSVYNGIIANQIEYRISAVEMLDNILDRDIRNILVPLIESSMLEELNKDIIRRLKLDVPQEKDCFKYLLEYGDEQTALAVLDLLDKVRYHYLRDLMAIGATHYSHKVREKSVKVAISQL